ncbi:HRDC domain-containing protein [Candidatus Electrothrix sp.]|uniref:HRDC domain-containing protein n=1 Tax=Candidatus Electrothrix sp. TaxID=2170559 RepID=UPI0040579C42
MSLQCKFFIIPTRNCRESEEELNSFLRSHRVLTVHREFVADKENSFWNFCVEYLSGDSDDGKKLSGRSGKNRVDYKEVLSPEDFKIFAALREWRKKAANDAGVPVYTLFTNEQLARIVTEKASSKAELQTIEGVGESRAANYGDSVIQLMRELTAEEDTERTDETGG